VIRDIYLFYFKRILPFIGAAVAGKKEPYFYLRDSVLDFEPPRALEKRILKNGFRLALSKPFTFASATSMWRKNPARGSNWDTGNRVFENPES